jgi:hypothetical protein
MEPSAGSLIDLVPHPAAPPRATLRVAATVALERRGLLLTFALRSEPRALALADPSPRPCRRDRLWEHTCCEAFVGTPEGSAYLELNLAPSGDWALWAFDDYRTGMRAAAAVVAPRPRVQRGVAEVRFDALLDSGVLGGFLGPAPYRVGLTAVVEDCAGGTSYFACRHAADRPDFHARDGWTRTVYPPADA